MKNVYTKKKTYIKQKRRNARQRQCRRAALTDGKRTFLQKVRAVRFRLRLAAVNGRAAAGSAADFLRYAAFFSEYSFSCVSPEDDALSAFRFL